ncbi:phosphotransferase [Pseudoalteromonas porphyrae]|uniref:Choline kinase n=1 Tax=Pseudoalteromonas porphyrae TaxID=187330 RepID=A0A0N1EES7_9GAMM|nr:phosphotransferase [Pseudoalteromonas porphyrae]KPH56853.1 choline kinase [Pseudoalteromonas porphyrae]
MTDNEISGIFAAFNSRLKIFSIERLHNGLSNDNFLVRTKQHAYLLKFYREHWPTIGLSAQALFAKKQVCPELLWVDEINQFAIFEYIEGAITNNNYTPELINKLVALHHHQVVTLPMDIKQELDHYRDTSLYQHYKIIIEQTLSQVELFPRDSGFCHNDLVKENIIENPYGMFLIDFEYAKTNDVYFDLAAIVVSCELDPVEKVGLLETYQRSLPIQHRFTVSVRKLECYQLIFLLLCILWYSARSVGDKVTVLRTQLDRLINLRFSKP